MNVSEMAARAKEASYILAALAPEAKDRALNAMACAMRVHADEILAANQLDLQEAQKAVAAGKMKPALYERLKLTREKLETVIKGVEELMKSKFGDTENPLLVSVRSGARASMPGMMDTILNLGLNDDVVEGLTRKTGNARFAWDSYRRFVQMYGDVVLGMKPANKDDIDPFEAIIEEVKKAKGVKLDNELDVDDLKELVKRFKEAVKAQTGQDFPSCAYEQLWGAICAVFDSWMNERAILYRKMEGIPAEWGTAVNVQSMVFGNMGDTSATGVCFSRDAATGEDLFNGEYLINAQGEDVVAGIRTPQQITKIGSQRWAQLAGISEEERVSKYPSMEEAMPEIYKELDALQTKLENHYKDMQDMEFTVQEGNGEDCHRPVAPGND